MNDTSIIRVVGLKKYFPVKRGAFGQSTTEKGAVVHAVDDVSFSIKEGEIFGVVGESGCGKTTLGRCIMRLLPVTEGKIFYYDTELSAPNFHEDEKIRKDMQMVFQNPFSSFNPKYTIDQAITAAARFHGMRPNEIKQKKEELMQYINLPADMLCRHPNELSGGQLQRLAIMRTLILMPRFIMADEPVSALDVSVQAQILNLVLDIRDTFHLTMMFISHELTVVEHICDRVMVMYLGAVMELGSTKDVFSHMLHPYSRALISAKPKESPEQESNPIILQGDLPSAIHLPAGCRFSTRCYKCRPGLCDVTAPELKEVRPGHWCACHFPEGQEKE